MYLKTVFIRFYKSFNFDYLRKYDQNVKLRHQWENIETLWYPYVRIPIDEKITTVVGANESGKTHLLTAIEKGLSGENITRSDFCRYSQFFAVEEGAMAWPDFGFEWTDVSPEECKRVAATCENAPLNFTAFLVFRTATTELTIYIPNDQGYSVHAVSDATAFKRFLPPVFRLKENVALPESVSIRFLMGESTTAIGLESLPREQRFGLFDSIYTYYDSFKTKETLTSAADPIVRDFGKFTASKGQGPDDSHPIQKQEPELALAHDLIRKVAGIGAEALKELYGALRKGNEAFANSLIAEINETLRVKLNFPNWWVQDREFRLLVSAREFDLVFTIRDRTGTEYSFSERSSGLRYFLSYYIQYLAHERNHHQREILLMDEPDAYLSNQGQQDLLKIFNAFANPEDGSVPIQLVYVTHSPFLIDKNHGERIRVLEKGTGDEGTRVVRDVSRNHYEPLRSAFGSFVAETTFMGNCNLIVEGPADQIILAGAAIYLREKGLSELYTLDLNRITIVPASGAPHIPYLVYLARGRDVEKPAIIVLLDSDTAGNTAKKGILRGGPKRNQLLNPGYILQLGDLSGIPGPAGNALVETEDLIPIQITTEAVQRYVREVCAEPDSAQLVTKETLAAECSPGKGIFDSIEACLKKIKPELHIEKIGFARAVIETIKSMRARIDSDAAVAAALGQFETNMKTLFEALRRMQREAERELTTVRVSERVNRAKSSFLLDHPVGAKGEEVLVLLEELELALDNSAEADEIKIEIGSLRRDFKINDHLAEAIEDYPRFKERLEAMRYAARLATQETTLQETAIKAATSNSAA